MINLLKNLLTRTRRLLCSHDYIPQMYLCCSAWKLKCSKCNNLFYKGPVCEPKLWTYQEDLMVRSIIVDSRIKGASNKTIENFLQMAPEERHYLGERDE